MTGSHIATALACDFTGQLKSSWNNSLTMQQKFDILNHSYKMKQEDRIEVIVEDGHDFLVATISNHFIGSPTKYQATAKSILINLRYPSLTDNRWYKDVFLTNVLKREDGTRGFWKQRFIAGLPKLFGQRILAQLRQNFSTDNVPFRTLTFGTLFGLIKNKGIDLCNELKLQVKYRSEKAQSRKEMGNFCDAFGLTNIEAPSTKAKRIQKKTTTQIKKPSRTTHPKPSPPKKSFPNKKKLPFKTPVTCFKCGKPGHKATECKVEQKVNELFADKPELGDKVLAILANNQSESDKDYYQDTNSDASE